MSIFGILWQHDHFLRQEHFVSILERRHLKTFLSSFRIIGYFIKTVLFANKLVSSVLVRIFLQSKTACIQFPPSFKQSVAVEGANLPQAWGLHEYYSTFPPVAVDSISSHYLIVNMHLVRLSNMPRLRLILFSLSYKAI